MKHLDSLSPTLERLQHSPIERRDQIADSDGNIGDPHHVVSTLTIMLRRKTITPEMYQAGGEFHTEFRIAHLDPLKAADFAQTRVSGKQSSVLPRRIVEARDSVWTALRMLGGLFSPCGSIAWAVLGEETTLEEWAQHQGWSRRPVHRQAATGVFVGALGVLVSYYGLDEARELVLSSSADS